MESSSILASANARDVRKKPFPYIVVRNALPSELADRLLTEFPSTDWFLQNQKNPHRNPDDKSNRRFDFASDQKAVTTSLGPLWHAMLKHHVSPAFLADFTRVFGASIQFVYPHLWTAIENMAKTKTGISQSLDPRPPVLSLKASIGINTPVTDHPSRARGVHTDRMHELFAGLLYLRNSEDRSTGGAFEIHRFKGLRGFMKNEVPPNLTEKVDEIPYEHNTMVMFLNTIYSLHAVSPRSVTPNPRQFLIVSGVADIPIFDNSRYQIAPKPSGGRGMLDPVPTHKVIVSRIPHLLRFWR